MAPFMSRSEAPAHDFRRTDPAPLGAQTFPIVLVEGEGAVMWNVEARQHVFEHRADTTLCMRRTRGLAARLQSTTSVP